MTHLAGSRFLGQHLGRANFSLNKHFGPLGQGEINRARVSAVLDNRDFKIQQRDTNKNVHGFCS